MVRETLPFVFWFSWARSQNRQHCLRRVSDVRAWNILDVYVEKAPSDKAYLSVGREIEGDKFSRTPVCVCVSVGGWVGGGGGRCFAIPASLSITSKLDEIQYIPGNCKSCNPRGGSHATSHIGFGLTLPFGNVALLDPLTYFEGGCFSMSRSR